MVRVGKWVVPGSEDDCNLVASAINRQGLFTLPHQIAGLLRQELSAGRWAPGDKLPSARQLSGLLDVSLPTAVEALRILAQEGFVTLRERARAVVNTEDAVQKSHRIVIVLPRGSQAFMLSALCERLMLKLEVAGYDVSLVPVPIVGKCQGYDLSRIKMALRRPCELVVCMWTQEWVLDIIRAAGCPFVLVLDDKRGANRVGCIAHSVAHAYDKFVKLCLRRGIRSVVQVSKWRGDGEGMVRRLRDAGMEAREWVVSTPAREAKLRGEALEAAAFSAFSRRLSRHGKEWLPDLLFFTDDHSCYGAMTALIGAGVQIPADVKIVTFANCGTRRAYATTLARMEYDPMHIGDQTAEAVLAYLRTGVFPEGVAAGPVFRTGGSFR